MSELLLWKHSWGPRILIACGYSYFLIFAQFGFIQSLSEKGLRGDSQNLILGCMAIAGIGSSLLNGFGKKPLDPLVSVQKGLLLCALMAFGSLWAESIWSFVLVATGTGLGVGQATVALAGGLSRISHKSANTAMHAAWGTGLAYFICNIPWSFNASPQNKTILAVSMALIGVIQCHFLQKPRNQDAKSKEDEAIPCAKILVEVHRYKFDMAFAMLIILTVLIWLDSSVFFIIQNSPLLKARSWGNDFQLFSQAACHFMGALIAGRWFVKGYVKRLGVITWMLFMISFYALQKGSSANFVFAGLYAVGISIYSTALVALPSYRHVLFPFGGAEKKAGLLYGVSGWLGSTLGIGMARDLYRIPSNFILVSGVVILLASFLLRQRQSKVYAL